jgi:hypothetical protein
VTERFAPLLIALSAMVLSLVPVRAAGAAESINDPKLGFTLTLPDGFVPAAPEIRQRNPKIAHAYTFGEPDENGVIITLMIEPMGGTIGRERLKPKDIPANIHGEIGAPVRWNGFDLDQFIVYERLREQQYLTYNVQVPLKPQAIQLKLVGPSSRNAELEQLMAQTLMQLDGQSNWLASTPAASSVATSPNYGTILLVVAIAAIVIAIALMWIISRHAPRGTLLTIAVIVYIASYILIPATRVREMLLLQGTTRLIGFIGIVLGLIDAFRKRKPKYAAFAPPLPPFNQPPNSPTLLAAIPPPPLPSDRVNPPPPAAHR